MVRSWRSTAWVIALLPWLAVRTAAAGPLELGIRSGVNISGFSGDFADAGATKSRLGLDAGAFARLPIAPSFGIQLEVDYAQKGAKLEGTGPGGEPITSTFKLSYVEVPVLARIGLGSHGPIHIHAVAGPVLALAVAGRLDPGDGSPEVDLKDGMKAVDFGLAGGLELGTGAGPYKMALEARYTTGLTDLYDQDPSAESVNQTFTVGLAVSR